MREHARIPRPHRRALLALVTVVAACRTPAAAPSEQPPRPGSAATADAAPGDLALRRTPAPAMSYRGADWLTRPERIKEERPERMLAALRIAPGMVVADIGAGVGYHTWRLAPKVLPGGRVYATDIQPQMLRMLEANVRKRKLANVTGVLSTDTRTGLPAGVIDLALLVDVYHELQQPEAFLRDLRRAMKPFGRIALCEFRAEDPDVPIRPEHKMTAAQVVAEMAEAGLRLVERHDFLPWQHLLVFSAEARTRSQGLAPPPAASALPASGRSPVPAPDAGSSTAR